LRLLLDTHIWLWSLRTPELLGKRALQELRNPQNELWLSPISVWEALLLHKKNRLNLGTDLARWAETATEKFKEASLTRDIAVAALELNLHGDPADRFLAATAMVLDLTLVTADARLLGLGNIATLANR
jgi:PIN domain nuclease of toxin-antitoxin system